jgi:hypothetical protein
VGKVVFSSLSLGLGLSLSVVATSTSANHLLASRNNCIENEKMGAAINQFKLYYSVPIICRLFWPTYLYQHGLDKCTLIASNTYVHSPNNLSMMNNNRIAQHTRHHYVHTSCPPDPCTSIVGAVPTHLPKSIAFPLSHPPTAPSSPSSANGC